MVLKLYFHFSSRSTAHHAFQTENLNIGYYIILIHVPYERMNKKKKKQTFCILYQKRVFRRTAKTTERHKIRCIMVIRSYYIILVSFGFQPEPVNGTMRSNVFGYTGAPMPLPRLRPPGTSTISHTYRTPESSTSEEEDRTDLLGRSFHTSRPKSRSSLAVSALL